MKYVKREQAGTSHCPSCNALAPIYVLLPANKATAWAVYTMCEKCKHDDFQGFMSEELKRNIDRRVELMAAWIKANTPAQRGRIFTEVRKLDKSDEVWEQSL